MWIFRFLLSLLSIQTVWLKPAANNSEPASAFIQEELRSKRQATFFDLLHQAIEKYESCADEHLAPLKSLASYKQYETLIPDKYPQNNNANVGAAPPNATKPNIKCTRVNLCITDRNSFSETANDNKPTKLGKALNTKINIPKRLPLFTFNENHKAKQPPYFKKPYDLGNVSSQESMHYSHFNSPNHQDMFTLFFKKLIAASQQQALKAAQPERVLGSAQPKPTTYTEARFCSCLNNTTTAQRLAQSSNQQANTPEIKSCPCLETVKKHAQTDSSHEVLESIADVSPNELKEFDQYLNLLLMRLDERAEKASNGELRQILEKLKSLKSAFGTNFEGKQEYARVSTPVPLLVGAPASQKPPTLFANAPQQFSFSKLGVSLLNTIFKTNFAKVKVVKENNLTTASTKNQSNKGNVYEKVNEKRLEDVASSHDSQFSGEEMHNLFFESHIQENSSELFSEDFQEAVTETFHQEEALNGPILAFKSQDPTKTVSNTKSLTNSNDTMPHWGSPILAQTNDKPDTLESSLETESVKDYYDELSSEVMAEPSILPPQSTYSKQPKARKNKNIQTPATETQASSSKIGKNDTKITISIIGDCNFKHIHVEQCATDEKKLEINEKEKINMATPSTRGQYKNTEGTSTRFISAVKRPQKRDSYAEPISLELYPNKSKPSTKPPASFHWHTIEKQSSKSKRALNGVWRTFQSSDVFDCGNCEGKNPAANSKQSIKYTRTPDAERSNSVFT